MRTLKIIPIAVLITAHMSASAQVYTDPATGKVGIGTTTPQQKLHVAGAVLVETNDDDVLAFNNTDNSWQYMEFNRSNVRQTWMGLNDLNDFYINKETAGNLVLQAQNGQLKISWH